MSLIRKQFTVFCLAFLASGCLQSQAPKPIDETKVGPNAQVGQLDDASVDGLLVGHRLMAAGEYELALRAYTRAAGENGINADVLSALGSANLRLGRLNQSNTLLRRAIERDGKFAPAYNNLGVVLSSQGQFQEAKRVFQVAYALDNGNSEEIRANLTKAIAKIENSGYAPEQQEKFQLVRRGNGRYLLLQTPNSE